MVRPFFVVPLAVLWSASLVHAQPANRLQPSISSGFAVPIDLNLLRENNEVTGGFVAPAVRAELIVPVSSRTSLHTLFELPASYDTHERHQGGGGYTSDIQHRDIVIGELIGLRIPSTAKTEVAVLGGFGLVIVRTAETVQYGINSIGRGAIERRSYTNMDPSVIGGIRASMALSERTRVAICVLTRATRRNASTPDRYFAWLTITPSIGLQVALSRR